MTHIKDLVDGISEEIDGAQHYAECHVYYKAAGNSSRSSVYKGMAQDELAHATNLHTIAVEEIEKLRGAIQAPAEMTDRWNNAHKIFVDRAAYVKTMLNM